MQLGILEFLLNKTLWNPSKSSQMSYTINNAWFYCFIGLQMTKLKKTCYNFKKKGAFLACFLRYLEKLHFNNQPCQINQYYEGPSSTYPGSHPNKSIFNVEILLIRSENIFSVQNIWSGQQYLWCHHFFK